MGYLDGFTRPDYSAPDIIGLGQFIQSGYDAGKAKAQNQALAQLSQKAYADTGDAQKADISQAIGIDPAAGYKLADMAQQQAQNAAAQKQQVLQRFGKAASAILQAKQRGDTATAEGIYQSLVPELRAFSAQNGGPEPPPTLDGSDMGALTKLAAMYGQMPTPDKGVVMTAGAQLRNPTTGALMATVPYAPQYENAVPNGTGTAAGVFDRNTGTLRPAVQAQPTLSAPSAAPPAAHPPTAAGAAPSGVVFNFAPGTDPRVIAAVKAAAAADTSTPGQFGVGAPKQAAAPAGYRYTTDGTLEVIPGGPADKKSAGVPGDPSKTGADYLNSIPDAGLRNMIVAISEGRMQVPRIYRSSKGGELGPTEIAAAVNQFDPSFNAADYTARSKTYSGFTSGKEAQQINALATVAQHLNALSDAAKALNNSSVPLYNAVANAVEMGTGDPRVSRFNLARDAVSKELERVWRGTGGSETGIQQWQQDLSANASPEQIQGAINQLVGLVQGKIGALKNQYVQGMGRSRNALQLLPPETQAIFERLNPGDAQQIGSQATAQTPIGATPQSGWSIQKVQQ